MCVLAGVSGCPYAGAGHPKQRRHCQCSGCPPAAPAAARTSQRGGFCRRAATDERREAAAPVVQHCGWHTGAAGGAGAQWGAGHQNAEDAGSGRGGRAAGGQLPRGDGGAGGGAAGAEAGAIRGRLAAACCSPLQISVVEHAAPHIVPYGCPAQLLEPTNEVRCPWC